MQAKIWFNRFLAWRIKHINQKQFVLILSVLVGISSGLAAVVIKNLVALLQQGLSQVVASDLQTYLSIAFPLVGILITIVIIKYVIRQSIYPGIPSTLYAISKRKGLMKAHNMFSSIITSAFTVGFGGSAGLEAPTVATSAAIGSNLGHAVRLNHKTKSLLIGCAAAGSMAAIFQAPIAALVFAIEVIMLDLTMASMVPLLLASISAVLTSTFLLGDTILFKFDLVHKFTMGEVPFYILLGVFTGIFSLYFTKIHNFTTGLIERVKKPFSKAIIGGIVLGAILFLFPPLYGEGYDIINALIAGDESTVLQGIFFEGFDKSLVPILIFLALLFFFKAVSTTITLTIGGVGGIFAPALFMGSTLGYVFAKLVNSFGFKNLSQSNFTLVGMAGLIAGILHAPLTAIFLIAEITGGYGLFVPLMIAASISYLTIKLFTTHSIYTYQLASRGELLTHDKDKTVLTLMKLKSEIETDLTKISADMSLGSLVPVIASSRRNLFPVVDAQDQLLGIVLLDDIRQIMFNRELYDRTFVYDLMTDPPDAIQVDDTMDKVMQRFESTGAWNLPVVSQGKYVGFVSKSKLFSAYRKLLQEFSDE